MNSHIRRNPARAGPESMQPTLWKLIALAATNKNWMLSRPQAVALVVGPCRHRRHNSEFLVFVLELVELVVDATLCQQLLVRAHFAQLGLMHHDDLVCPLHG